jgi:hypothetical protein
MDDHDESSKAPAVNAIRETCIKNGQQPPITPAWIAAPAIALEMGSAASGWLGLLGPRQRARSQFEWGHHQRLDWHYVPRDRLGLTLGEMNATQAAAFWDLLGTLLSAGGLERARNQLVIERILGEMTGNPTLRDPGNYALAIFGDPAGSGPWSWRAEGHHLSLNTTVAPGHGLAVTPNFFGADPAKVPHGRNHHGFRLLGKEEDSAFSLIRSLEGEVRDKVLISDCSLGDIVSGPGRENSLNAYEGMPLSGLNAAQQNGVLHILELFAATLRNEIAAAAMARIIDVGTSNLHFAWAGSLVPGNPHYFRIHGPGILVEYDNTQDGANHTHTIWIDPQGAFGRDLLKTHYRHSH